LLSLFFLKYLDFQKNIVRSPRPKPKILITYGSQRPINISRDPMTILKNIKMFLLVLTGVKLSRPGRTKSNPKPLKIVVETRDTGTKDLLIPKNEIRLRGIRKITIIFQNLKTDLSQTAFWINEIIPNDNNPTTIISQENRVKFATYLASIFYFLSIFFFTLLF
jgi:hypothetical protein